MQLKWYVNNTLCAVYDVENTSSMPKYEVKIVPSQSDICALTRWLDSFVDFWECSSDLPNFDLIMDRILEDYGIFCEYVDSIMQWEPHTALRKGDATELLCVLNELIEGEPNGQPC